MATGAQATWLSSPHFELLECRWLSWWRLHGSQVYDLNSSNSNSCRWRAVKATFRCSTIHSSLWVSPVPGIHSFAFPARQGLCSGHEHTYLQFPNASCPLEINHSKSCTYIHPRAEVASKRFTSLGSDPFGTWDSIVSWYLMKSNGGESARDLAKDSLAQIQCEHALKWSIQWCMRFCYSRHIGKLPAKIDYS